MKNFTFCNPTKILFGKGTIAKISQEIPSSARIMVIYGGGSIHKNGVYDQVMAGLSGRSVAEFGGVEANPKYETLMKAVAECRQKGIDYLLAVGGGSVIDGTKFIATALKYKGEDPWDILASKMLATEAVPFASVLTLPATGSEMNNGAVISRLSTNEKLAFYNTQGFPQFSILDPQACYSLPKHQVINGVVDSYAHILEQYLNLPDESMVMDRWSEGLLLVLNELGPKLAVKHDDYDTVANFMLTATMALNGFIGMGITPDFTTHMIGHELTAMHGMDHGLSLAVVYPGVMNIMRDTKHRKLVLYAERVWGITQGSDSEKIDAVIARTDEFFRSLGMKTRLSEHGIGEQSIEFIVDRFTKRGWNLGEKQLVTPAKVGEILRDRL